MNVKRLFGIASALAFSSLMMACASEAATTAEEEAASAEQGIQDDTADTANAAETTEAVAPAVYCGAERIYDPSYCHTKTKLMTTADNICTQAGYRITQIVRYDTRFCSSPKAGAVTYKCCD